ncbi:MAG: hypothetical protein LBB89_13365 [Treponema sp.]|jgi:hypothetical protein|nr:hypothetical protein [Treponema sp.]
MAPTSIINFISNEDTSRQTVRYLHEILVVLLKPQNRIMMILNTVATGITLLGIISILDIIKNWIGG